MDGRSLSGYQQKRVWLNDGAGKFVNVAQAVGATDIYDGRAVALADLWNRGVLDVVVANQKGPLLMYKNTVTPENKWIISNSKARRVIAARSAPSAFVLGRPAASADRYGWQRFLFAEPATFAFRPWKKSANREGGDSLAVGKTQTIDKPVAGQIYKIKESA